MKELVGLDRTDAAAGRDRKVAQGAKQEKLIKFEFVRVTLFKFSSVSFLD